MIQEVKPHKIEDLQKNDFVSLTGDFVVFSLSGYNRLSNIFLSPFERMSFTLTNRTNSRKFIDEFFFVESLVKISDNVEKTSQSFCELQLLGGDSLERFSIYVNGSMTLDDHYNNIKFHMRINEK